MKALAFAFAGAALAVAAPASAAPTIVFDGQTGTYGNNNITASTFSNLYTFTVATAGTLSATISSTAVRDRSGNLVRNVDFSNVSISGGSLASAVDFLTEQTGTREYRSITPALFVAAGTYTILARGTVTGTPGSYAGDISFAAVPEPATWGLMILGFGMVGGAMRRRAVKTAVRFA